MTTTASKIRRLQKHAAEKAENKVRRDNPPSPLTAQEVLTIAEQERYRNIPRGSWLNGKLYVNSFGGRKGRSSNAELQTVAERENHDLSVAAHIPAVEEAQ